MNKLYKLILAALFLSTVTVLAANKIPLVIGPTGQQQQLQFGDQLSTYTAVTIATFGALPSAVAPTSVTITTVSGSAVATLSGAGQFVNHRGIVAYNAGTTCVIGATACSAITVASATGVVTGYAGASSGSVTNYKMRVSACNSTGGCTAASTASAAKTAATILSRPGNAGSSGNLVSWSVGAVASASKYVWWRSADNGATYSLWTVTDENTYVDFINTQTISALGRWSNTPLAAATKNDFVSTISSGGGTTAITMADVANATGSFTAWPDDTAAINSAYSSIATSGGSLWCSAGFYKVRQLIAQPGVSFNGAGVSDSGIPNGCVIYGTDGNDVFTFNHATWVGPFLFSDVSIVGGRNAWWLPANGTGAADLTHTTWNHIRADNQSNAAFGFHSSQEELQIDQAHISGGVYGIDIAGVTYNNKSSLRNVTITGSAANCISFNTTTDTSGGMLADRISCSSVKQNAVYIKSFAIDIAFNSLITESNGRDLPGTATTATCTSGSATYALASVAGLSVGMNYTIKGCGSGFMPAEGTICSVVGSNIQLYDSTCVTPVLASRSIAGVASTTAIFDDIYTNQSGGSFYALEVYNSAIGQAGRYSIHALTGARIVNSDLSGFGFYDNGGISWTFGLVGEWIRPALNTAGTIPPGQNACGNAAGSGYNACVHTTPPGGDWVFGLSDSAGSGSGTFGSWLFVAGLANPTVASISSAGSINAKGSLTLGAGTLAPVAGELALSKVSTGTGAPGAGGAKIGFVCGTNAGTGKLIAYAGTSTGATTILDNIGSGVTGC